MGVINSLKSVVTDGHLIDLQGGSKLKPTVNLKMHIKVNNEAKIHGKLKAKANQSTHNIINLESRTMTIGNKLEARYVG